MSNLARSSGSLCRMPALAAPNDTSEYPEQLAVLTQHAKSAAVLRDRARRPQARAWSRDRSVAKGPAGDPAGLRQQATARTTGRERQARPPASGVLSSRFPERDRTPQRRMAEPEPHHRVLHHRLQDAFSPTYLTILSIIQAVALADLATIVAAEYRQFTLVHWVLGLLTFCVLIIVWNVYTIQGAIWRWIPDVRDAAMPFVVGALELFLNHTLAGGISFWLVGLAGIAAMGALGTWYMHWRARTEGENGPLLSSLSRHHLLFALYYTAGAGFLLLLAWANSVGNWEGAERVQGGFALGTALLVGVCLAGAVIISHLYWRKATSYARTGRLPTRKDAVK